MGTGALTLCCCCCEGSVAGGPLVGGGGGMKKDPMGAYPPPSLLLYDGVGDVDDLLKLNTLDSEFCNFGKKVGQIRDAILLVLVINLKHLYKSRVAWLPVSPSKCQTI